MPDFEDEQFVLDEPLLAILGISEVGWEGDRVSLPETAVLEIGELLNGKLADEELGSFMADLNRGFANAVEMAFFMIGLRQDVENHAIQIGWNKQVPTKLGVLLRDYIRELRLVLEQAQRGDRKVTVSQFVRDIESFPALARLVDFHLEEAMRGGVVDPLRTCPAQAAEFLPDVLVVLETSIAAGVKRGPTSAPLTYLAGVFVHAFRRAMGQTPGRTWNDKKGLETGLGLEICRRLSRELHDALPASEFPFGTPDMAKPYRKAFEKLRHEERSSS